MLDVFAYLFTKKPKIRDGGFKAYLYNCLLYTSEAFLDVESRVKLISTEATEILGHDDPNLAVFHV